MIKKILGSVLLVFSVVGGAVAADFIKHRAPSGEGEHSKSASKEDSHGKADKKSKSGKKDKKGKDGSKGGDDLASLIDGPTYLKFKRQFVVPVMKGKEIEALVIMNLNYELDGSAPENFYSYEPKLRDAIVRELLTLSDKGIFGEDLTTPQNYEKLRSTLLEAGQQVLTEGIKDVLILDIARQDQ